LIQGSLQSSVKGKMTPIVEKYKNIFTSVQYQNTHLLLQKNTSLLTPASEVAYLVEVINQFKPKVVYEIGSFFCETTKVMAEAMTKETYGGTLHTTDPYGAERCPQIIEKLPDKIKSCIKYYPFCSMEMILHLKEREKKECFLDLTFIDGNHDLEYALFDLISVSNATNYGGCIVFDNIENRPTRLALKTFLNLFPWWTCLLDGECVKAGSLTEKVKKISSRENTVWAVLIAPQDNIVGGAGKVFTVKISDRNPTQILINFADTQTEKHVLCEVNKSYFPFNYHITGDGFALEEKHLIEIYLNKHEKSKQVDLMKPSKGIVGEGFWLIAAEVYPGNDNPESYVILDRDNPINV